MYQAAGMNAWRYLEYVLRVTNFNEPVKLHLFLSKGKSQESGKERPDVTSFAEYNILGTKQPFDFFAS